MGCEGGCEGCGCSGSSEIAKFVGFGRPGISMLVLYYLYYGNQRLYVYMSVLLYIFPVYILVRTRRKGNIYERRVLKRMSQGRVSGRLLLYTTNYKLYFIQSGTIREFTV